MANTNSTNPKDKILDKIANILSVRNLITLIMTILLGFLLLGNYTPSKEIIALYCSSYGAVVAYFFAKGE